MLQFVPASRIESDLIITIAQRAVALAVKHGHPGEYTVTELLMDVGACHLQGCPLRLVELSTAKDSDLAHDVFGIRRHIDRKTGKLDDGFSPRYSQLERA